MFKTIPIAVKIFGIAVVMLLLFIAVTLVNYFSLNKVNRELKAIAHHMTPLTNTLTQTGLLSLKQKIHLEHTLSLYIEEPVNKDALKDELDKFHSQTENIKRSLSKMQHLSSEALEYAREVDDIIEYARLKPYLDVLSQEYIETIDQSEAVIDLFSKGNINNARLLMEHLTEEQHDFARKLEYILEKLMLFLEKSSHEAENLEDDITEFNTLLSTVSALTGILLAILLIIGLTRPINKLLHGTQQVTAGNLDTEVNIHSRDEIETLALAFDKMVKGIKQKEQLKATFGQYVDPRIVDFLINKKQSNKQLTHQKTGTVFFSDIVGFSGISEWLTAQGLVNLINQYLTLASEPIISNQGIIDQFIGDAILAFWTTPFIDEEEHAIAACVAALEQLKQLEKFRKMMPDLLGVRKDLPDFDIRIGIASSSVITGYLGSQSSKSYTLMGDAIQMAEALETANKVYGTTILISEETKKLAENHIETRLIGKSALSADETKSNVHELLAISGQLNSKQRRLIRLFDKALVEYSKQNWQVAKAHFKSCLQIDETDKPSQYYLAKLQPESVTSLRHRAQTLDSTAV